MLPAKSSSSSLPSPTEEVCDFRLGQRKLRKGDLDRERDFFLSFSKAGAVDRWRETQRIHAERVFGGRQHKRGRMDQKKCMERIVG